jgi:hypothetical protein
MLPHSEKGLDTSHPRQERILGIGNGVICPVLKSRKTEGDGGGGKGARDQNHWPSYCMIVNTEKGVVSDILLVSRFMISEEGMCW